MELPKIKQSFKAAIWYVIVSFIVKGMSFLMTPVFTRLMSMEAYGNYSSIRATVTILSTVATAELCGAINRAKYDFPGKLNQFISSITVLGTLITATLYGFALLFRSNFEQLFGMRLPFIHVAFCTMLVAPALNMLQTKCRLENEYRTVVAVTLLTAVGSAILSVIFVTQHDFSRFFLGNLADDLSFSRFFGESIVTIIASAVIYVLIIVRGKKLVQPAYWRYSLAICLPLIPHMLAGTVLSSSDRIMIDNICGGEAAALYSITYTCSAVVSMLFNALNQAWVPWFNEQFYRKRFEQVKNVSIIYFFIFVLVSLILIMIAPEVLYILGGEQYLAAKDIMPIVMISCLFQFTNAFFVNVEMFEKKTGYTAVGTTIAAVLNVCLNGMLIPVLGYTVAAYTTLLGFVFLFVFHLLICRRIMGTQIRMLFHVKLFAIILAAMVVLVPAFICLYSFSKMRLLGCGVLIFAGCVVVWKYKNQLIKLIGS